MRSSRKLLTLFACVAVGVTALGAKKEEKTKEPDKKKESAKKKRGKDEKKAAQAAAADPKGGRLSLPILKGHDAKGLKIPYYDAGGALQMTFNIGVASRLDDDHVQMNELQVETYGDDGESEMTIELPTSVFDLNTRVLTTNEHVTIRRHDFEITGQKMEFNTATKQGKLAGNVRMLIYDLGDDRAPVQSAVPAIPAEEPARE